MVHQFFYLLVEIYSSLAQSVEHSAVNRVVARSSRAGGAMKIRSQWRADFSFVLKYSEYSAIIKNIGCCKTEEMINDKESLAEKIKAFDFQDTDSYEY